MESEISKLNITIQIKTSNEVDIGEKLLYGNGIWEIVGIMLGGFVIRNTENPHCFSGTVNFKNYYVVVHTEPIPEFSETNVNSPKSNVIFEHRKEK